MPRHSDNLNDIDTMSCLAVVFDLDGTLLDTLEDIGLAMNLVLSRRGLPEYPLSAYRRFVGDGAEVLVRRCLAAGEIGEHEIPSYVREFKEAYALTWNVRTRPYPGIPDLLRELAVRGIPAAVLSNKPHEFALRCIEAYFPGYRFEAVLGEMPGRPRKPDPAGAMEAAALLRAAPGHICYLGDTDTDMLTAAAAGMVPVGVAWGFRPAEELLASGARHLIASPAGLLALL